MPKYESQNKALQNYAKQNYERLIIQVPKGMKEEIKKQADAAGTSINRYVLEAVEQRSGLKLTLDGVLPWKKTEQED